MITTATGLIVVVAIFAIMFWLARRILRLAIKLALVGAVIVALAGGGLFGWWRGWFEGFPSWTERPSSQTNQQRNLNKRPAR